MIFVVSVIDACKRFVLGKFFSFIHGPNKNVEDTL